MSYTAAIEFIEFSHAFGTRLNLHTMKHILQQLGSPHERLNIIHVAGTNGKGSTSSHLASMLMAQGYRTGLFTSPHMHCYTERIRINGVNISQEDFMSIFEQVKALVMPLVTEGLCPYPAMFDWMTLIGFVHFDRMLLDVVVLEVGLGGLEDATNVIDHPLAAVITPIDIDHVDILGAELSGIAAHKAGIIKEGCPVIFHHQLPDADVVIRQTAMKHSAPSYCLEANHIQPLQADLKEQVFNFSHPVHPMNEITIRMMGVHQMNNASLALLTLLVLRQTGILHITDDALRSGLQQSFWAGRLEVVSQMPLIIIDGAHNLQGADILYKFLLENFADKKINFLMGMLNNKDVDGVLNKLTPLGNKLYFTRAHNPKAVNPVDMADRIHLLGKEVHAIEDMTEAVQLAVAETTTDEVLVITGSLYLVGDAKAILLQTMDEQKEAS